MSKALGKGVVYLADVSYIRDRITELRIKKNVSEIQMSTDLDHNESYIRGITSGRILPSVPELLKIIDYFEISPCDFFDKDCNETFQREFNLITKNFALDDMNLLLELAKRLADGV